MKQKKTSLLGDFEIQLRDGGTRNNDTSATEDSEKDIAQIIIHSTCREICTCFDIPCMHTIFV